MFYLLPNSLLLDYSYKARNSSDFEKMFKVGTNGDIMLEKWWFPAETYIFFWIENEKYGLSLENGNVCHFILLCCDIRNRYKRNEVTVNCVPCSEKKLQATILLHLLFK